MPKISMNSINSGVLAQLPIADLLHPEISERNDSFVSQSLL